MIWEQTTLGVQEGGASGEAVFLQTPQPDRGPSVHTAYGGMDKAQALGPDSLGYLTRTSPSTTLTLSVFTNRTVIPNSHKGGLLGLRTWLLSVTSPRKALTHIHLLVCPH